MGLLSTSWLLVDPSSRAVDQIVCARTINEHSRQHLSVDTASVNQWRKAVFVAFALNHGQSTHVLVQTITLTMAVLL